MLNIGELDYTTDGDSELGTEMEEIMSYALLRQRTIGNTVSNTEEIILLPKIKTQPATHVIKVMI